MPSRNYFLKEGPQLVAYRRFAEDVAKLLGANPDTAETEMNDMVEFEIKIANVSGITWKLFFFGLTQ